MRKRDVHTKECLQRVSRALNRRWRRERDRRAGRAGSCGDIPSPTQIVMIDTYWILLAQRERERDTHTYLVQNLVEPEHP